MAQSFAYAGVGQDGDPKFSQRFQRLNSRKRHLEEITKTNPIESAVLRICYNVKEVYYHAVNKL